MKHNNNNLFFFFTPGMTQTSQVTPLSPGSLYPCKLVIQRSSSSVPPAPPLVSFHVGKQLWVGAGNKVAFFARQGIPQGRVVHAPLVHPHAKGAGGGVGAGAQAAGYAKWGGRVHLPNPPKALHYVLIQRRAGVCNVATLERAIKVRAFVPLEVKRGFKSTPAFAGVRPCRGVALPVLVHVAAVCCSVGTHGAL